MERVRKMENIGRTEKIMDMQRVKKEDEDEKDYHHVKQKDVKDKNWGKKDDKKDENYWGKEKNDKFYGHYQGEKEDKWGKKDEEKDHGYGHGKGGKNDDKSCKKW